MVCIITMNVGVPSWLELSSSPPCHKEAWQAKVDKHFFKHLERIVKFIDFSFLHNECEIL